MTSIIKHKTKTKVIRTEVWAGDLQVGRGSRGGVRTEVREFVGVSKVSV